MASKTGDEVFESSGLQPLGMWDHGRLCVRLMRDPRVSPWIKAGVPILTAAYVISPIDLIPDFLLGVGQLDDLGVIGIAAMLLFRWLPRLAPRQVVAGHLAEMGFGRHDGSRGDRSNREESERVVEAVFRVNRRDSGDASRT